MSGDPLVPGAPRTAGAEADGAVSNHVPLRTRVQQIRRACRQMFGIPDFERYLEHMQSNHPGAPVLSEREFHKLAIDRRYGAARPRCC
jgi:uncharacterized short protein YbdD (DUF466 family)